MLIAFRREAFTRILALFLSIFFARLSFAFDQIPKGLSPLEEKIGQAKILYYDFQFKKAEELLNETIVSLRTLLPSPVVNHDLSEAYLNLALTQDAQDKSKLMTESLYEAVSFEPTRELDSSKYAPTFISQFNKTKQKYLATNTVSTSSLVVSSQDLSSKKLKPESQPLTQNSKKKPFYKTWPFFLILGLVVAGGGAGAAIALSGHGGGGGGGSTGPVTVGGTPQ